MDSTLPVKNGFNYKKIYAELYKGRPDEPASWQAIAVYSKEERDLFISRGWKPAKAFMDSADRARRRDN
jgi:hypothetical protein